MIPQVVEQLKAKPMLGIRIVLVFVLLLTSSGCQRPAHSLSHHKNRTYKTAGGQEVWIATQTDEITGMRHLRENEAFSTEEVSDLNAFARVESSWLANPISKRTWVLLDLQNKTGSNISGVLFRITRYTNKKNESSGESTANTRERDTTSDADSPDGSSLIDIGGEGVRLLLTFDNFSQILSETLADGDPVEAKAVLSEFVDFTHPEIKYFELHGISIPASTTTSIPVELEIFDYYANGGQFTSVEIVGASRGRL